MKLDIIFSMLLLRWQITTQRIRYTQTHPLMKIRIYSLDTSDILRKNSLWGKILIFNFSEYSDFWTFPILLKKPKIKKWKIYHTVQRERKYLLIINNKLEVYAFYSFYVNTNFIEIIQKKVLMKILKNLNSECNMKVIYTYIGVCVCACMCLVVREWGSLECIREEEGG